MTRRVLVVDDNRDTAATLSTLLKLAGHEVYEAGDGQAALEAALRHRPEFVFLDIGLPGLDGYEVARRLRSEASLAGTIVVAVTGYGTDADRLRAQEAGFDLHVLKPADPNFLESLLTFTSRAALAQVCEPGLRHSTEPAGGERAA